MDAASIWKATNDSTYRIPFNFMMNWLLSEEKELGEPFRYALILLTKSDKVAIFGSEANVRQDRTSSNVSRFFGIIAVTSEGRNTN